MSNEKLCDLKMPPETKDSGFEKALEEISLADALDLDALKNIMDYFCRVTGIGGAVLDLEGNVLISTAFETICAQFHRKHPATLKNCQESDTILSKKVPLGTSKAYLCKNGMWDIVTPIEIAGKHIGNLFIGQFFYDDEESKEEQFRQQAEQYGFDEIEYMKAFEKIPRLNRKKIEAAVEYYAMLASTISSLSLSSVKLKFALIDKEKILGRLKDSEEKFRQITDNVQEVIWLNSKDNRKVLFISPSCEDVWGLSIKTIYSNPLAFYDTVHDEDKEMVRKAFKDYKNTEALAIEFRIVKTASDLRWISLKMTPVRDDGGKVIRHAGLAIDVTDRVMISQKLQASLEKTERAYKELKKTQRRVIDLEQRNAVLATVVTANHEINQPLTILQGNIELLQEKIADPALAKYFERVDTAMVRIQNILRKLRDVDEIRFNNYSEWTPMLNLDKTDRE
jgi:PAS domain S-box-containing protein